MQEIGFLPEQHGEAGALDTEVLMLVTPHVYRQAAEVGAHSGFSTGLLA